VIKILIALAVAKILLKVDWVRTMGMVVSLLGETTVE
jgi:hypothetical protein